MDESRGVFVWHDLSTSDRDGAIAFYRALFGWGTQAMDMGENGVYTMWSVGERPIGGVVQGQDPQVPPHWGHYVTVPDIKDAADRAARLGGTVLMPPMEIPDVGWMAIVADPQGATIMPFQSLPDRPEQVRSPEGFGTFCWHELMVPDPEKAASFYGEIFGWAVKAESMGEMGTYWMFTRGGDDWAGGMMQAPPGVPPHWLGYVHVENVDASRQRALELGAKDIVPPKDIPNVGRFAILFDPQGAAFAVFQGKE